jgi:DNA polymerase I-like protein with 3'-5' exonuclease and polymerase domains
LGVQYGMGEESLARRIGKPPAYARELLRLHRQTYPRFWAWSDGVESHAMLRGWLRTVFGWVVRVGADANPRSLRNFPCQANGAEMMRLACCRVTERGVSVAAPVHDALLVEGSADAIDEVVTRTQEAMAEASEVILSGFRLRSDAKIVRWPDRYMDDRGREFWGRVMALLPEEVPPRPHRRAAIIVASSARQPPHRR